MRRAGIKSLGFALVFVFLASGSSALVGASPSQEPQCARDLAIHGITEGCPRPGASIFRASDGSLVELLTHEDTAGFERVLAAPNPPGAGDICTTSGDGNGIPYQEPCISRPVHCVERSFEHAIEFVYVQLPGQADQYGQAKEAARGLVRLANGIINHEAKPYGVQTLLKTRCHLEGPEAGEPIVHQLVAQGSGYSEVRARFHEPNSIYVVFMDDGSRASAQFPMDERQGLDNAHLHAPSYAWVTHWSVPGKGAGVFSDVWLVGISTTMLHELGHTMGAVARGAPHQLGVHCSDGHDVMCYDEIVADSTSGKPPISGDMRLVNRIRRPDGAYPTWLPICNDYRHFDCGNDDYFNPRPQQNGLPAPLGQDYLATHWNIGHPDNLYIRFSTKNDPLAQITTASTAPTGSAVVFDASGSSDVDGDAINRFFWDFGDGTFAEGARVTHAYAEPGRYVASLVVYDEYEGSGKASTQIDVTPNLPPTASIRLPSKEHAGVSASFDGSGSQDPDGAIVQWIWSFGDGSVETGVQVEHAFVQPGWTTVTLTVTDDSGATAQARSEYKVLGPYD